MYRYLIFAYDVHYPNGGMADCIHKSNDINDVIAAVKKSFDSVEYDFVQVYDCKLDKVYSNLAEEEEIERFIKQVRTN
ncbi:hypothetical protein IIK_05751 [Bacillus cereus VD102]|nr:hypothetical protein IIK_05751 [Bacillus cereus VD102]